MAQTPNGWAMNQLGTKKSPVDLELTEHSANRTFVRYLLYLQLVCLMGPGNNFYWHAEGLDMTGECAWIAKTTPFKFVGSC